MKVIIAGGRDFNDLEFLQKKLGNFYYRISEVVSGAAKGADTLGEMWAYSKNIPVKQFPANWKEHGKSAGPIRNREMGKYADALIAFWDGKSKGTKDMIGVAIKEGLWVKVFYYESN